MGQPELAQGIRAPGGAHHPMAGGESMLDDRAAQPTRRTGHKPHLFCHVLLLGVGDQRNAITLRYTTQGDCVKLWSVSRSQSVERAFQRARTEENKKRRATDLVEAARGLALRDGARCVTLTAIAAHAGVHASAVRRYFDSREEILLVLTAQEWASWAGEMAAALKGSQVTHADQAASLLAESLEVART